MKKVAARLRAINMLPELVQMQCSMMGAWGAATKGAAGAASGALVQLRSLDFGVHRVKALEMACRAGGWGDAQWLELIPPSEMSLATLVAAARRAGGRCAGHNQQPLHELPDRPGQRLRAQRANDCDPRAGASRIVPTACARPTADAMIS